MKQKLKMNPGSAKCSSNLFFKTDDKVIECNRNTFVLLATNSRTSTKLHVSLASYLLLQLLLEKPTTLTKNQT